MTKLFLDDNRMPEQVGNYILPVDLRPIYRESDWHIVRSYDEFVHWILHNGLPDLVSFDHDLEDAHYSFAGNYDKMERTGYHCAKWMVEFCMYEHLPLPQWIVHSMNVVGAENITSYLKSYMKVSAMAGVIDVIPQVKDYSEEPFFVKKVEQAKEFIEKHGLPEQFQTRKDDRDTHKKKIKDFMRRMKR